MSKSNSTDIDLQTAIEDEFGVILNENECDRLMGLVIRSTDFLSYMMFRKELICDTIKSLFMHVYGGLKTALVNDLRLNHNPKPISYETAIRLQMLGVNLFHGYRTEKRPYGAEYYPLSVYELLFILCTLNHEYYIDDRSKLDSEYLANRLIETIQSTSDSGYDRWAIVEHINAALNELGITK